jgi:hypothetical protein
MVKHRSGTRWPNDRVIEWRCVRSGPQNRQLRFGDLAHKITMTVSWFGSQNQVDYCLSVVAQNRYEDEDGAWLTLRSSCLLWLEASQARIPSFASKLVKERWQVVQVASSWKWNRRRSVRWCRGWRGGSQTKIPFITCNFLFNSLGSF